MGGKAQGPVGVEAGVLGTPVLRLGDREIGWPPGRPGRLLASLLVARGRVVTDDRLVDEVWGEDLPADARATLHTTVGRARRALGAAGDRVRRTAAGYRFDTSGVTVDADVFTDLLARARQTAGAEALPAYDAALALWRGPAWAGYAADIAQGEALRLEEAHLAAREERAEILLQLGREREAVDELRRLVAEQPLRDRPPLLLMRALHRLGATADALAVFAAHRIVLADELGLDPSPELEAAQRAVLARSPSARSPATVRAPAGPDLVGRSADLQRVRDLLGAHRCVTVVGAGGVGKTSLVQQLAAETGSAWWVDLTSVSSGDGVLALAATALELEVFVGGSLEDALDHRLAAAGADGTNGLLVLDNCEHVQAAAAALAARVVAAGSGIRVLATSRERLGLPAEQLYPLRPLQLPDAHSTDPAVPSVALFLDRARAAAPDLDVTPAVLEEVNDLVRRLDGLPLAIELAASRVGVVSLGTLRDRLDHRLDLLRSHRRPGPARHQALVDTIGWSYDLLDDAQRRALRRLSVFAGAFDLDAAEAVLGPDSTELVLGLVERSLLVSPGAATDRGYRMLETVRTFARSHLTGAEDHEAGLAHARWARTVSAEARRGLAGREVAWWTRRVETLLPEFHQAVAWGIESGRLEEAVEIVPDLYDWAYFRVRADVMGWAVRILQSDHPEAVTPSVLATAATYCWMTGDQARAAAYAARGVALAGGPASARAYLSLHATAIVAMAVGDLDRAYDSGEHAVEHAISHGNPNEVVLAIANLLLIRTFAERPVDTELALLHEHEARVDSPAVRSMALYAEAEALAADDPARALALFTEARTLAAECGNRLVLGVSMAAETALRGRVGTLDDTTLQQTVDAVEFWLGSGNRNLFVTCLRNAVSLLDRLELPRTVVEVVSATTAHTPDRASYGIEAERLAAAMARARTLLTPEEVDGAWRWGQRCDLETVAHRVVAELEAARQRGVSAGT